MSRLYNGANFVFHSTTAARTVNNNRCFCGHLLDILHSTSFKYFFPELSLNIPVSLRLLRASTRSAAVQNEQTDKKKIPIPAERCFFVSFLGAWEGGSLRELGTQNIWELLGPTSGLNCLRETSDTIHKRFCDLLVCDNFSTFVISAYAYIQPIAKAISPHSHSDFAKHNPPFKAERLTLTFEVSMFSHTLCPLFDTKKHWRSLSCTTAA